MKTIAILIFLFVGTSCGYNPIEPNLGEVDLSIDPDLMPYVNDFFQDLSIYGDPAYTNFNKIKRIRFGSDEELLHKNFRLNFEEDVYKPLSYAGVCTIHSTKSNKYVYSEIVVNNRYKDPSKSCVLKNLMYHELGHCALDLGHFDEEMAIMNTYLMPCQDDHDWEHYVADLFEMALYREP